MMFRLQKTLKNRLFPHFSHMYRRFSMFLCFSAALKQSQMILSPFKFLSFKPVLVL